MSYSVHWGSTLLLASVLIAAPALSQPVPPEPAPAPQPEAPTDHPASTAGTPSAAPHAGTASDSAAAPAAEAAPTAASAADASAGLSCLDSKDGCEVDDLKTPTAPAYSIIGVVPSQVETPRTPKDVAVALYNAYNGGSVSQNVALEVAPFWLVPHHDLTYDQYVNASLLLQLVHNLTVSAATTAVPAQAATDIGFGLRTNIFFRDADDAQRTEKAKAEAHLQKLQEILAVRQQKDQLRCADNSAQDPCPAILTRLEALAKEGEVTEEALRDARVALEKAIEAQYGFRLSVAGALAYRSDNDNLRLKDFLKGAGWLNGGYRGEIWEVTGLVRFTAVDAPEILQYVDLGARVGGFGDRYGVYAEGVYRVVSGDDPPVKSSGRLVGTFEYKLSNQLWLSASYGKDNDSEVSKGAQFALLGVNFQVGERQVKR